MFSKEKIANKIISLVCKQVKFSNPEFAACINLFTPEPVNEDIDLSTDWQKLYYNPGRVIRHFFINGSAELKFQLIHIILHGLFGDVKVDELPSCSEKELWALMDIKVNYIAKQLGYEGNNKSRMNCLEEVEKIVPPVRLLGKHQMILDYIPQVKSIVEIVKVDNHESWKIKTIDIEKQWKKVQSEFLVESIIPQITFF